MSAIARKTKTRTALVGAVLAAVLSTTGLGTAGTSTDPEITDVAGDGNFINGHGQLPGFEHGPDTRPGSVDELDLRAVWFETEYETTPVLDPTTGDVLRVEYDPTALVIRIQTQGPAGVVPVGWSRLEYTIPATLPQCNAAFHLRLHATNPPLSEARIVSVPSWAQCDSAGQWGSGTAPSPIAPTFDGTVSTIKFPLADYNCPTEGDTYIEECSSYREISSRWISVGAEIAQPSAQTDGTIGAHPEGSPYPVGVGGNFVDETLAGRTFTIGQDVPPDIDCTNDPGNPECQP